MPRVPGISHDAALKRMAAKEPPASAKSDAKLNRAAAASSKKKTPKTKRYRLTQCLIVAAVVPLLAFREWRAPSVTLANGWTPSHGAKQAEAIHRWKPWTLSTGPKSPDGKATVARNV